MPTITIDPSADTYIWDANPTTNYGSDNKVEFGWSGGSGAERMLLNYDFAHGALPDNSAIISASLSVNATIATGTGPFGAIYPVTKEWEEDVTTWEVASDFTDPEPGQILWTTQGGDFDTSPSAGFSHPTSTGIQTLTNQLAALVQRAVNAPAAWFGWIAKQLGEATTGRTRISPRDHATEANRPRLTVTYLSLRHNESFAGNDGGVFGSFNSGNAGLQVGMGYN